MDPLVEAVIKVGGSLLGAPGQLDGVLGAIARVSHERRLLVVPGGGPFADAVREVDRRLALPESVSHWMAVLAMDQYAHVVASRMSGGTIVSGRDEIAPALAAGLVPVLAPYRWLRAADPLPHGWDVTSDSLAAWLAGAVGARRLVLIKPAGATGALVDAFFSRALPGGVTSAIVPADRPDEVAAAVCG